MSKNIKRAGNIAAKTNPIMHTNSAKRRTEENTFEANSFHEYGTVETTGESIVLVQSHFPLNTEKIYTNTS